MTDHDAAPSPTTRGRATGDDARFSYGLALDVAAVLHRHGYPAVPPAPTWPRCRQALFNLIYQEETR